MPTLFSNHYNTSGSVSNGIGLVGEELPLASPHVKIGAGWSHARVRRSHARISMGTVFASGDEMRMLTIKSSDRIYSIQVSSDGAGTDGEADLGLYLSGSAHDGALPTANAVGLFGDALKLDDALDRVEEIEAGDLDFEDLGMQAWEMINVATASTYSQDPIVNYDLTFTGTTTATGGVTIVNIEVYYTAGD